MLERTRTRTRVLLRAAPWFGILLAISVVQVIRSQPFDAAIFGLGAVLVAVDALGALPVPSVIPSIRLTVPIVVAAVLAAVLVVAPRHGLVSGIATGAVGVATLPLAWFPRPGAATREEEGVAIRRVRVRRAAIGWSIVVVAMCLVELWSFLMGRMTTAAQGQHPAISELLDPVLDDWLGRLCFVIGWLTLGGLLLKLWRRPDA